MSATASGLDREFQVDALHVKIYENRAAAGQAAAHAVATEMIRRLADPKSLVRVIFAAAPSQNEFLEQLVATEGIDWERIAAFHMDEYLGLGADHPASFRNYLHNHLFGSVPIPADRLCLIPAERADRASMVCLGYEEILRREPPDLVCAGIGENGHLAFNDPPVADFLDPVWVKVVRLDEACRIQQVHDGCFAKMEDVPRHAITLTIPALLSAPKLAVIVPGPRKAEAVRATLQDPISEACPATALRRHSGATLYLDRDSASLLG